MSDQADPVLAERAALVLCALDCIQRLSMLTILAPVYRVDDLRQISDAAESAAWNVLAGGADQP